MRGAGAIPGQYNLVVKAAYDTADHQVPVAAFVDQLREGDVPEEVCVVGLSEAFADDEDLIEELAREIDRQANDLENRRPLPTIQFAVEGSFHRSGKSYDLRHDGELHSLQRVFGPPIERQGENWLVAPF